MKILKFVVPDKYLTDQNFREGADLCLAVALAGDDYMDKKTDFSKVSFNIPQIPVLDVDEMIKEMKNNLGIVTGYPIDIWDKC